MAAATRIETIVDEVITPQLADHEKRIRRVEELKAQLLGYALLGSVIGGALAQVVFKLLFR